MEDRSLKSWAGVISNQESIVDERFPGQIVFDSIGHYAFEELWTELFAGIKMKVLAK